MRKQQKGQAMSEVLTLLRVVTEAAEDKQPGPLAPGDEFLQIIFQGESGDDKSRVTLKQFVVTVRCVDSFEGLQEDAGRWAADRSRGREAKP